MTPQPRYRIESSRGAWSSVSGPDYECTGEHCVIDARTNTVVLRFAEWGDWPFMLTPEFKGAATVVLAAAATHVVVTDHDGATRAVPIPGASSD